MSPTITPRLLALAIAAAMPGIAMAAADADATESAQQTHNGHETQAQHDDKTLETVKVRANPFAQSVEDVIAPVTVLSGEELDARKGATLGDTVSRIPGVTTTYFGPGVGRPVIRGLDGSRVAVLGDGLGASDVSNVSQDHAVSIEPFLADQIEVLKGPSALLYGSGAIGGVVNAVDGRIPEAALGVPLSGRAELRHDTGSDGFTGMGRLDAGNEQFVVHADTLYRNNAEYDVADGRLANSQVDTRSSALGASLVGDWGFAGLSLSRYQTAYGNPAEPGDDEEGPVTLDMTQDNYRFKAGINTPFSGIESLRISLGHNDYEHTEFEGDEVGTRFLSQANQYRAELIHAPIGAFRGALGVQGLNRDFKAIGEEAFVPATQTRQLGVFLVEQAEWDRLGIELGARGERVKSQPEGGEQRRFSLASLSAGMRWRIDDAWHLSLNLDRAQRAPAEEELFADGPHAATATYEIGDPGMRRETANGAELGLHFHSERVEAELSVYRNRFDDFIYLADTGLIDEEDELPIRRWTQDDASFRGIEGEATLHLGDFDSGHYALRFFGDRVRASQADGTPLPRIPASRFGAELHWHSDDWNARIGAVRTAAQDRLAPFETPTDGYTLVNASVGYVFSESDHGSWEAFVQGSNLTDQDARLATSVVKDEVPLPGRNIGFGIRALF